MAKEQRWKNKSWKERSKRGGSVAPAGRKSISTQKVSLHRKKKKSVAAYVKIWFVGGYDLTWLFMRPWSRFLATHSTHVLIDKEKISNSSRNMYYIIVNNRALQQRTPLRTPESKADNTWNGEATVGGQTQNGRKTLKRYSKKINIFHNLLVFSVSVKFQINKGFFSIFLRQTCNYTINMNALLVSRNAIRLFTQPSRQAPRVANIHNLLSRDCRHSAPKGSSNDWKRRWWFSF